MNHTCVYLTVQNRATEIERNRRRKIVNALEWGKRSEPPIILSAQYWFVVH